MSHPSEWKFICPECGKEAEPSPMCWVSDGKFDYVEVLGFLRPHYFITCTCWHGRSVRKWPYSFRVEVTKDQAKRFEEWRKEKTKEKFGKVIE